jgi:hypothetical protein
MTATGLLSTIVTYVHTFSDTLCSKPCLEVSTQTMLGEGDLYIFATRKPTHY